MASLAGAPYHDYDSDPWDRPLLRAFPAAAQRRRIRPRAAHPSRLRLHALPFMPVAHQPTGKLYTSVTVPLVAVLPTCRALMAPAPPV